MKKKNLPLIIGISLPVIFIIVISVVIFTPSFFIKPQYNFIYSTESPYYSYDQGYKNTYIVENNHIATQALPVPTDNRIYAYKGDSPTLYLYDVKNNSSHQITLDEAKNYFLDPGPSSPDGYIVRYEYSHNGIFELFGSNQNGSGYFIEKNNGKKELPGLMNSDQYYQGNFKLIGWVK
jgi:hypothetical protein